MPCSVPGRCHSIIGEAKSDNLEVPSSTVQSSYWATKSVCRRTRSLACSVQQCLRSTQRGKKGRRRRGRRAESNAECVRVCAVKPAPMNLAGRRKCPNLSPGSTDNKSRLHNVRIRQFLLQNLQQTARHSSPAQSGTCAEVPQDKQAALSLSSEMGSVDVLRQRSGS